MSYFVSAMGSSCFSAFRSLYVISKAQPITHFRRGIGSEPSGAAHSTPSGTAISNFIVGGPWDANNRIRVVGATLGVVGAVGVLFDTFYRRATKQELMHGMDKLDAKIDREMGKLDAKIDKEMGKLDAKIDGLTQALLHTDAKIDGLTQALLHTNQRDKIAAETENRELKMENQRLREKKIES